MTRRRPFVVLTLLALAGTAVGCDTLYYKTMKRFGVEKRDILVKRVREARQSQDQAREEFRTALERFRTVVEVENSPLEEKYTALNRELERSEDRARAVRDRIDSVKDVADDLFKEWQKELGQYSDRRLRAESEKELRETRRRTEAVIAAMARANARIEPVLRPLRDRVLFLKHNLNARALGALGTELGVVQGSVDTLLADLELSIKEADGFIREMEAANAAS